MHGVLISMCYPITSALHKPTWFSVRDFMPDRKKKQEEITSWAKFMHLICTLAAFGLFSRSRSLSQTKITLPNQSGPNGCWHLAVRLNKLAKRCKQYTLCTSILSHTLPCLSNTSGHTQTLQLCFIAKAILQFTAQYQSHSSAVKAWLYINTKLEIL